MPLLVQGHLTDCHTHETPVTRPFRAHLHGPLTNWQLPQEWTLKERIGRHLGDGKTKQQSAVHYQPITY
jgi:hypothetical protein